SFSQVEAVCGTMKAACVGAQTECPRLAGPVRASSSHVDLTGRLFAQDRFLCWSARTPNDGRCAFFSSTHEFSMRGPGIIFPLGPWYSAGVGVGPGLRRAGLRRPGLRRAGRGVPNPPLSGRVARVEAVPVGAEGDRHHEMGMTAQRERLAPGGGIPELDGFVVAGAGGALAVRAESETG